MSKSSNIGPYTVVRLLGKGGMSEVYEVENPRLGTRHALKLYTSADGGEEVRTRFESEGRLLARLNHPRVVKVTDIGTEEGSGRPYFVMDLILDEAGKPRSLAEIEPGSVEEDTVGRWYDDLRIALQYIHAQGVVHRDLKLQNVLIGPDGHAVLTDFGVSKIGTNADGTTVVDVVKTLVRERNGRGLVMGSVGYMAPEIEMGVEASPQSDYYALGVIVFRLLTGLWCDARTDLAATLETYGPAWQRILPKLLHANPLGRACVPYDETKREFQEAAEAAAEERWLKEKARGHFARHAARWLIVALLGTGGVLGALLVRQERALSARGREAEALRGRLSVPTFADVFKLPPPGKDKSPLPQMNAQMALADAWILNRELFEDLRAGRVTLEKASSTLAAQAEKAKMGPMVLFDATSGYMPRGNPQELQRMLQAAAVELRALQSKAGEQ